MRDREIEMLTETLEILDRGSYCKDGKTVPVKLSPERMRKCRVLLPEDVRKVCRDESFTAPFMMGSRCSHACLNMDSYSAARQMRTSLQYTIDKDPGSVLVLNFANPVNPGGGVRRGALAQEEDLCRKSSLLLSLESDQAQDYYAYNRSLHTDIGSNAMILTPEVEIIRDENGDLLDETVIVSVLTCAAPIVSTDTEQMGERAYRKMFYNRIVDLLKCAAFFGYKYLVLGAWGCGAFGNDAHVVSNLFYMALKELEFNRLREKDLFRRIVFAVLDRTPKQRNFQEFFRNFDQENFFRDENRAAADQAQKAVKDTECCLDQIRGSLFGGAVGDALGYAVEFMQEDAIFERYGEKGIREYELDDLTGKALISDDTQMTLFTANGILVAATRLAMRGIGGVPRHSVRKAYLDWLCTQDYFYEEYEKLPEHVKEDRVSWLLDVPELYARRAPGITCLTALRQQTVGKGLPSYVEGKVNESKGCGGVMRVAPVGLKHYPHVSQKDIDLEGAELAAITHGHSLGYMPAAVLVHIISRIVYSEEAHTLEEVVLEARDAAERLFAGDRHLKELTDIINLAVALAHNGEDDLDNIHRIGEGWVAEEALGIAIYCALKYENDFSACMIASVNHRGDSDSTGAIAGNILGARLGYSAIEDKWKQNLELSDVILELADDLCHGCPMTEYGTYRDPDWVRKYMYMKRKECD